MHTKLSASKALKLWHNKKLISNDQLKKLSEALEGYEHEDRRSTGIVVLSVLGAVLAGLGVILFIGSHWGDLGPWARISIVVLADLLVIGAAWKSEKMGYQIISQALWLLSTIVLGAAIMLIGQIFHFTLNFWQGTLYWFIGAATAAVLFKSSMQAVIALPLLILTLGWLGTGEGWGFGEQFYFLFSDQSIRPLFAVMGVALIGASTLFDKSDHTAPFVPSWFKLGILLVALPVIISTGSPYTFELFEMAGTTYQYVLLALLAVISLAGIAMGRFQTLQGRYALVAALVFTMVLLFGDIQGIMENSFIFGIYIILVFAASVGVIELGVRSSKADLVNTGILAAALIILIQYFSWSFAFIDRSLAFIIGGILLIFLAVFLEKKRRKLLASMK